MECTTELHRDIQSTSDNSAFKGNRPFAQSGHMVQNYAGMQVTQWDFQTKGTCTSPVPLRSLYIPT